MSARTAIALLVAGCCLLPPTTHGAPAPSNSTLWVLQGDQAVPYDPADFSRGTPVRIPGEAVIYPDELAINGRGQMMLPRSDGAVWLWDGKAAAAVRPASDDPIRFPAPEASVIRSWLLGDDGASLFVVETFPAYGRPGAKEVRVLQTGLDRRCQRLVLSYVRLPCQYCQEPAGCFECPAASLWAPGGVARDFMVLTHWYHDWSDYVWEPDSSNMDPSEPPYDWPHGSIHQVVIRRVADGDWAEDADRDAATLLDGMGQGTVLLQRDESVEVNPYDSGCDSVRLISRDTVVTLSNTCGSYPASNYNAGISTSRALLAPGGRRVALTLIGSSAPNADIRLRVEGHADIMELRSLRRALAEMAVVEVYTPGALRAPTRRIAHAELVGWTSDREVLVLESGRIIAIDVVTGHRRESSITTTSAGLARVVWR